ncbi:MAG: nucleotidyltransferase domain-containing protein [Saprospirales bacterium]|nr:nucleotidyltransferase domain-containing protein [Saprospirales bacterium]
MTKEQIILQLSENKEFLQSKFYLETIALFGSYARNENSEKSDIDLLVTFSNKTNDLYSVKRELKTYLHDLLKSDVDICNEKYIKPFYKTQILSEAIYV